MTCEFKQKKPLDPGGRGESLSPFFRSCDLQKIGFLDDITYGEKLYQPDREFIVSLLNTIGALVVVLDREGRIILFNRECERVTGYSAEELYHKPVWDFLLAPEEIHELKNIINACASGKCHTKQVNYWLTRDGARRLIAWNNSIILNESQSVEYVIGTGVDITEIEALKQALRQSEEKFSKAFNASPFWVAISTLKDGTYLELNDTFTRVTGFTKAEALGRSAIDVGLFRDKSDRDRAIARIKQKGSLQDFEFVFRRKSGELRTGLWNAELIDLGEQKCLISIAQDITERKQAEQAMRDSEEKYRSLIESSTDSILMLDPNRNIVSCNKAFFDTFGYDREDVEGKSVRILHPSEERFEYFGSLYRKEMDKRGFIRDELELKTKDGTLLPLDTISSAIRGADGAIKGYAVIYRDLTERRKAEMERVRLQTALSQVAETIVITDSEGLIQYANPAFSTITGYSLEEALGRSPRILKSEKHDDAFYKNLWDTISQGRVWTGHMVNKKKNGSFYEEEATISPVRDPLGNITNFVAVKRDVTNEVRLEAQLRQAQKLEAIGTLAGGIAHDFNNILTAVIGFTQLAIDDAPEATKLYGNLQQVYQAANRARDLVNQILAFSRQQEQDLKPVRIELIIKEALKLLRATLPSTVDIKNNVMSNLGYVLCDPTQIHQVIMNLCANAAFAMRETGGVLEVSLSRSEHHSDSQTALLVMAPGPYLKLTVSDTGSGIDPENLDRIFEPYFTTKGVGEGTGLGLAAVDGIVRSMGGLIQVDSESGKGSTFNIFLPLVVAETDAPPKVANDTPPLRGDERILLVDDETAILRASKQILESLGYTVTTSDCGTTALELFRANAAEFDIVITDLTMPKLRGDILAEELMTIRPDIPVILCTGFSEVVTEERAKAIGIRSFLGKPLLKKELAAAIRTVLDRE